MSTSVIAGHAVVALTGVETVLIKNAAIKTKRPSAIAKEGAIKIAWAQVNEWREEQIELRDIIHG